MFARKDGTALPNRSLQRQGSILQGTRTHGDCLSMGWSRRFLWFNDHLVFSVQMTSWSFTDLAKILHSQTSGFTGCYMGKWQGNVLHPVPWTIHQMLRAVISITQSNYGSVRLISRRCSMARRINSSGTP